MTFFYEFNFYLLVFLMLVSYLIGSISFGIVISKLMNLGDLRSIGSGNIGATNVLRTGSKKAAALTVILDGGKGFLTIHLAEVFFHPTYGLLAGMAVFFGHIYPLYHKFKGGKGVATFLGIIIALDPLVGSITCGSWLCFAFISKKSSVAALGCSLLTPIFFLINKADEKVILSALLAIVIWNLHKANIKRLVLRTEPSISFKTKKK